MFRIGKWLGFDTESVYEDGLTALNRHDYEAAAQAFKTCIETGTQESTVRLARFHLAECYSQFAEEEYRHAEYEKAWDEIELSFALAHPTAERHLLAARIARRLGNRDEATSHLDSALTMAPEHTQALALQVAAWYEEGRTDEAISHAAALRDDEGRHEQFLTAHRQGDRNAALGYLLALASTSGHS